MDKYLREKTNIEEDDESNKMILQSSIANIKCNTHLIICHQLDKIQRLINEKMWLVHHIISTYVFKEVKKEDFAKMMITILLLSLHKLLLIAKMNNFINNNKFNKKKVVFIMGATGTGKSRLFIDLVSDFRGEIINSNKMLVYKRLEIITNKITNIEKQGVRHYLLASSGKYILLLKNYLFQLCENSTCSNYCWSVKFVYLKLVEDPVFMFKYKCDTCFIRIDVERSILNHRVDMRVDQMVNAGLVDEVLHVFIPNGDYTKRIRWSIGVPEEDNESKKMIPQSPIANTKCNTRLLI
ncbi:hypothetical protein H5410_020882 [Solanum commersonii]|uniref:Uncharacterized protein n=1 Tax=Solanum commersonii TaxID=4109 RepID=A0A9J5Z9Q2_SOLCO|nr:hypothetical protein H5410_020882 [Solanum commersonii]